MHKKFLYTFSTAFLLTLPQAFSQTVNVYEAPEVVAVENKLFNPKEDISVHLGVLPLDAFYKGVTLGVSYTKNYQTYLGWEIVNANVAFTQDTGLKRDLLDNFSARPKGILEYPQYYLTSNLIYTPIYSKSLLFNKTVAHSETSFVAGGGMVAFNSGDSAPIFGGGAIFRLFKNHRHSFKFDGRLYYVAVGDKSSNFLLDLSIGWTFELSDEVKKDAI